MGSVAQTWLAFALLALGLAACQEGGSRRRFTPEVPACSGKKIAVLDLAEFADSAGIPPCNVDTDFKVMQPEARRRPSQPKAAHSSSGSQVTRRSTLETA